MFKKGFEDWLSGLLALGVLIVVATIIVFLASFIVSQRTEKISANFIVSGDVFNLDSLVNTEVRVDNRVMKISELAYRASKDTKFKDDLEREVKRIINDWSYVYDNWVDYKKNERKEVKKFRKAFAIVFESGNDRLEIEGENFNKEYCLFKCGAVAKYDLYENIKISLIESLGEV